jgi:hypothetical protein
MTRRQAFLAWIGASALFMLIGAFGPWVKALGMSVSGTDGSNDGWLVVGVVVVGGALVAGTRRYRAAGIWALLAGLAGAAVTLYDRHDVQNRIKSAGAFAQSVASVGWGLNLALIASISLAAAGAAWLTKIDTEMPQDVSASGTEGRSDLARAIEAGLIRWDAERGVWVEQQRPGAPAPPTSR